MYSRYLDEKSLVENRRTGGKGGEEGSGSGKYFEDFWEEESELGLGKKGFRNFRSQRYSRVDFDRVSPIALFARDLSKVIRMKRSD